MEFEYFSSFILLLSFVAFVFAVRKLGTRKPNLNLPPGPHLFSASVPPHYTLRDLAKKYGPLMHLQLGEIDSVIVSSPEMAKQFLKTHDIVFASRPSLLSMEIGCYGNTDLAFAPYRPYWRQLRKICTLELLSSARVQSSGPIRVEEVSNLCRWIAQNKGSPINLTDRFSMTNYDIMVRAVLGKKTDEKALFTKIVKEGIQLVSIFHAADVFPSMKFLHGLGGLKRKIENHHRQLDRIIGKIVEDRKRENAEKINDGDQKDVFEADLLDVLLKFQVAGSTEIPLTNDNIKAVLLISFLRS